MAKRELSSTLRGLKFMQRAAQREEKVKKEEEFKPVASSTITRKCVVIMEGDPHPGAVVGRMSFQSFNPSVDKLNEEASNVTQPNASSGRTLSRWGFFFFSLKNLTCLVLMIIAWKFLKTIM
ncbi:hypothetical protein PTKIN_Ptkin11bG0030300 [Pterospermum kingtungense]